MIYLTPKEILLIHSMILQETGGTHGVRDHGAVLSLGELPRQTAFGRELYPGIFTKAAVYARNVIMNHPFLDGNKRTGIAAALVFLENNGYHSSAREGEIEKFALKIVKEKMELKDIAKWLKAHTAKTKKRH